MAVDVVNIEMTVPEKYMLIERLAEKMKFLQGYHDGDRAEHIKVASRLLELAKSLPDDGDAA